MSATLVADALLFAAGGATLACVLAVLADWLEQKWPSRREKGGK